jgi:4-amino-4-deoxy-L-arabinose transferase-like glycosyltransferase
MQLSSKQVYRILLFLAVAVNFSGMFLTIIGPDGSLYAAIAKKMALNNNFIELFGNGTDWLDKPHFPFWVTALSFKIFGIHYWSYKLPAVLFLLMGAVYTWKFAKEQYNETIANWAVLILLTAEHIILSNTDVRAEPYLTGLIIAAVYHFYKTISANRFLHLFLGSLFAACAIMTKGMFALIPIGAAVGGHLLLTRNWKAIFNWRWLIALVLIAIMILPELYTLYYQFDLHPEKVVFGKTNVSGIRFFFWDSQFGRFFNTGPIKGKGDLSFFIHTTLWAFLPWSIMLYVAIYQQIRKGIRKEKVVEWYSICGAMATFLLFSLSKFQLPHYLNIVFPFFAVITADYLFQLQKIKTLKIFNGIHFGISVLVLILAAGLYFLFRPVDTHWVAAFIIIILFVVAITWPWKWENRIKEKIMVRGVVSIVAVNLFLNWIFYPELLKYQGGTVAARYINQHYPGIPVVQLQPRFSYTLEFDLNDTLITVPSLADTAGLEKPYLLFVLNADDSTSVIQPVQEFANFPVSKLNGRFVDHRKRDRQLQYFRLYEIKEGQ